MKGNIMDKKILLGGAAALLLVGNMYATPASASIDLSIGGEVKLTGAMSECGPAADADGVTLKALLDDINGAAIDDTSAATASAAIEAINSGITADSEDLDQTATLTTLGVAAGPCAGADRSGIDWGYGKKLTISASGTLANGLGVSFSDDLNLATINDEEAAFALTLDSAVGSLTFKNGGGDAVGKARVAGDADVDVNGTNLGFHGSKTTGHGGMGILWQAPSVGDLDLYVGWSPNSGGDGLDTADYENTFSVAAIMDVSGMSIGAGYAAASESNAACAALAADTYDVTNAEVSAYDVVDQTFKGDYCGDQTLMHIAASMSVGDLGLGLGYSVLDTDEADKTVMHIDASTSMSGYDLGVGYRQTTKDYAYGTIEDTQNVLSVSLGTSLGDGVDFGLAYSTNNVDLAANTGANGDSSNYFAEASLTVGF
jgi:hypothetical protein